MAATLGTQVRVVLACLGLLTVLVAAGSADAATTGTLALALTAVAIAVALVVAVASRSTAPEQLSRPRAQIDPSALVSQSDPDAAGHSRPRAPGAAASAA